MGGGHRSTELYSTVPDSGVKRARAARGEGRARAHKKRQKKKDLSLPRAGELMPAPMQHVSLSGWLVLPLPTTPAVLQAFWASRVGPFDRLAIGGWHVARGRRFVRAEASSPQRSQPPLLLTSGRLRVASCTQCAADSLTPPTSKQARLLFPPRGGVEHCRRFQGGAGREDR